MLEFTIKQLEAAKNKMLSLWTDGIYGIGLGVNSVRVYVHDLEITKQLPKTIDSVPIEYTLFTKSKGLLPPYNETLVG